MPSPLLPIPLRSPRLFGACDPLFPANDEVLVLASSCRATFSSDFLCDPAMFACLISSLLADQLSVLHLCGIDEVLTKCYRQYPCSWMIGVLACILKPSIDLALYDRSKMSYIRLRRRDHTSWEASLLYLLAFVISSIAAPQMTLLKACRGIECVWLCRKQRKAVRKNPSDIYLSSETI